MKVFEFAGVIFNADNVCSVQKVTINNSGLSGKVDKSKPKLVPGFQVVTIAGGMNFTFNDEKERDEKFAELLKGMEKL